MKLLMRLVKKSGRDTIGNTSGRGELNVEEIQTKSRKLV
jgi:hypothetical protein